MTPEAARSTALTIAVGATGAAAAWAIGAPAPFLTGPALCVSIATIAGLRGLIPAPIRDACFLSIGIGIGATVTPEVIATAVTWPLSLAVLTVTLLVAIALARGLLERAFGYDPMTALLSGLPGHLSYIISLSADMKADMQKVALVQSMRVLLLTLLVPVILVASGFEGGIHDDPPPTMAAAPLIVTAALSLALGLILRALNVPAAFLLAAMAVSGTGHATAVTIGAPPQWLTTAAFVLMGSLIGTRFNGMTLADLRAGAAAGIGTTLITCAVAAAGAMIAARLIDQPAAMLLIAFAPGGVEVMAAMAVQIGVEPAFVAAHHVLRLLILTFLIPVLLARLRRRLGR